MTAVFGQIVAYVTKVVPTFKDPTGMGDIGTPDVPANYGQLAAVVQRVISASKIVVAVLTIPPFAPAPIIEFDPLNPKWGTWRTIT